MSPAPDAAIPPVLVDTHVHILSPDHDRFPLRPTGLGRHGWAETGRDVEAFLSLMDHNRVSRAIAVQPVGPYGYDNSYLLQAVAEHLDRLAAVPAIDVDDRTKSDGELAASIARVAGAPGVVGIRLFGVGPGSSWAEDEARARSAFRAAGAAGLVVVLTVMPGHLQALSKLIGELSDVRVALDHCGFPDLSEGRVAPDAPLLALQDAGHVSLKVSSHLLRDAAVTGGDAAATGDPVALVAQLAAAFGGERLLWGSDYPQTDSDYGALLDGAAAATRQLDVGVRTGFFSGNATQVFFAGR